MGQILDDWFGIEQPQFPDIPKAQDTAETQQDYNLSALQTNIAANRVNQTSPYASLTWSPSGTDQWGNTTYTANTQLAPEQQALLDQLLGNRSIAGGTAGNLLQSIFGSSAYGSGGELPDLTSAIQPMLDRQLDYLDPYFQKQLDNKIAELRNRGLEAGNPAYDYEIMNLMQQQDRSVGDLTNRFTDTAMNLWKLPISGIQQLMGMSGPAMPEGMGFASVPGVSMNPVDFAGIQGREINALMEQYKAEQAQYNSTIQALGAAGGTLLGAPPGTLLGGVNQAVSGGLAGMLGLQAPTGGKTGYYA